MEIEERSCVNPSHLEVVTPRENALRARGATETHCVRGHEVNLENTRIRLNGTRCCRPCERLRDAGYRS